MLVGAAGTLSLSLRAPTVAADEDGGQWMRLIVRHRSGQSFITWPEDTELQNETYRVYRSGEPVTAGTLYQATLLYEVPEDSGNFYADRCFNFERETWQPRQLSRYVIDDFGQPLPEGVGLLVWTLGSEDFGGGTGGAGYYGVTVVGEDGTVYTGGLGEDMSFGPVVEAIADPLPVEVRVGDEGHGHLFLQYMDLRQWNPTLHAPNPLNNYYGLDVADWAVTHAIQYAYPYTVGEPAEGNVTCPPAEPRPLLLDLHGYSDNAYDPLLQGTELYDALTIKPLDIGDTWYFGFAEGHDYRLDSELEPGDQIANYTELRVLRMIFDLLRHPELGPRVDPERIYVFGGSMGGSGALALALRYPQVFAAAYAEEPMTNYRASEQWFHDLQRKWGTAEQNLPVVIRAPADWAAHLEPYAGTGVWVWQDHQWQVVARAGAETAPLGMVHGRLDEVISWQTQGRPAYAPFNAAARCWGGKTLDIGHQWVEWTGLPPSLGSVRGVPFFGFQVVRSETVPGLSNASGDAPLPPPDPPVAPGSYNQGFEWSASWDPWDGAPVDEPERWEIALRTVDGERQTVDVTPRRLQRFSVTPGAAYRWENHAVGTGELVASGEINADGRGLITVRGFEVAGRGSRLTLVPATP